MATLYTQGWDLLAVTGQQTLNALLLDLYNSGALPKSANVSYEGISFVGTIGAPSLNLNPQGGQGTNSLAEITVPIGGTITVFGTPNTIPAGTALNIITNLSYITIQSQGKTQLQLSLDLSSQLAVYSVVITDPGTPPPWVPILNGILQYYLQQQTIAGVYYLGTIDLSSVPGPLQPTGSSYFATQPNPATPAANALAMVANTTTGRPGLLDFSGVPPLIPNSQNAALYVSNRCLLVNLMLPQLASSLSTTQAAFDINGSQLAPYTLSLNQSIGISGEYDPDLNSLNVYVNNSGQIQGDYGATGYPLSGFHSIIWVDVGGYFQLTPACSSGTISFSANAPDGSGSIHLSTGGWFIVGALIIATFGTLGGAMAAVVAIVVPIIITQLKLTVSMGNLQQMLQNANVSFTWPAQGVCPLTCVSLPGDMVLSLRISP